MRTDLFDFDLPEDLIALRPASPRDAARLLVVAPGRPLRDAHVGDLPDLLAPGDALVVNDTRVIPAALEGERFRGEARARVEVTLLRRLDDNRWRALARPAKRLAPGDRIRFGAEGRICLLGTLDARVEAKGEGGEVDLAFDFTGPVLDEAIASVGRMPLPPYIAARRPADDSDEASYQTVFAEREGAVAAPTAGLHFTPALLERLARRGISRHRITLHVGAGTFLPVKTDDTDDHRMHAEWAEVSEATAAALNDVHRHGGRIVAVGSTALRALESATGADGIVRAFRGETGIFITPGYQFRAVDAMMTNFHLPRSTLIMLAAAFVGLDEIRAAYAHAVRERYRFYSYGDATLLLPARPSRNA